MSAITITERLRADVQVQLSASSLAGIVNVYVEETAGPDVYLVTLHGTSVPVFECRGDVLLAIARLVTTLIEERARHPGRPLTVLPKAKDVW